FGARRVAWTCVRQDCVSWRRAVNRRLDTCVGRGVRGAGRDWRGQDVLRIRAAAVERPAACIAADATERSLDFRPAGGDGSTNQRAVRVVTRPVERDFAHASGCGFAFGSADRNEIETQALPVAP